MGRTGGHRPEGQVQELTRGVGDHCRLDGVTFVLAGRDTPPAPAQALAGGPFRLKLSIAYDPDYPRRSWVAVLPLNRQDGNRLYQMSAVVVLINTLLIANLALWSIVFDWPKELVPAIHMAPMAVITLLLWMRLLI